MSTWLMDSNPGRDKKTYYRVYLSQGKASCRKLISHPETDIDREPSKGDIGTFLLRLE